MPETALDASVVVWVDIDTSDCGVAGVAGMAT